jgi:hypothetical protein
MPDDDPPPPAPRPAVAEDRWRALLLAGLLGLQAYLAWQQLLGLGGEWREYRADPELQRIARPFWLHFDAVAITTANVALLLGAGLALATRAAPGRSRRCYLLAFALYVPLQVLARLRPAAWCYDLPPETQQQGAQILAANAPLLAIAGLIDLVPFLLSVPVGLLRAGLHQAHRHPERPVGAVVAFAGALQLALAVAVLLAVAEPLQPAPWLATGLLLLLLHHTAVAAGCYALARPGRTGSRGPRRVLRASALLLLLPGLVALGHGLLGVEFLDRHLIGFDGTEAFLPASELPGHLVVFCARAASTALAANELLARTAS